MCRNLNVSKAGYYAWRGRSQSQRCKDDALLTLEIEKAHRKSRSEYGSPRVHVELRNQGHRIGRKRVARIMKAHGLRGKKRHRSKASSPSPGIMPAASNLVNRTFNVARPNVTWATDITQFATAEGWLYLAVALDLYSRMVVGWSMGRKNDSTLAVSALQMALGRRRHPTPMIHSDRGRPFTSEKYYQFLADRSLTASMSRKGDCWDNAVVESFFATLKVAVKPDRLWRTRNQARAAIFDYIETWYNTERQHSHLGYISPRNFEAKSCVN